jgi:LytR cell envelope-related transcriptional attenuator
VERRPIHPSRPRDARGVVFPSAVVVLSAAAVIMAAVAFVATRGDTPQEKEITPISQSQTTAQSTPTTAADPTAAPPKKHHKPKIDRSKIYVVVFNNSNVTGLAGRVAAQAGQIGWQVVGADNWYGTIPTSTVYYPQRLERAGRLLALDLGIQRTAPAVDPMRLDRLTVILTGPLDAVG